MKPMIAVIALALLSGPALAQKKMYRCGSQYQDRPCDESHAAPKAAAPSTAAPARTASEERRASQKQIRCENFGRQREDLGKKQADANKQIAEGMDAQIKALDRRMAEEGC